MGVDIDEAGGDESALGVDLFAGRAVDLADRRDTPVLDREVADEGLAAIAVDDQALADDQIILGGHIRSPHCC